MYKHGYSHVYIKLTDRGVSIHWTGLLEWAAGLDHWTAECGVKSQAIPARVYANVTRVRSSSPMRGVARILGKGRPNGKKAIPTSFIVIVAFMNVINLYQCI